MRKFIIGLALFTSVTTHAFMEGLAYDVSFKNIQGDSLISRVIISNMKFKGKDIYAKSNADKDRFEEKVCESFKGISKSSGIGFKIFVSGKDGQIFETEPLGLPIKFSINNPMGIIEDGELKIRKVQNESVYTLLPVITCEVEKKSSWF